MTWLSVGTRALSVLVVLPLLLTRFTAEEVAVWYVLVTMIGLQQLADLGFAPTFVRVIAYAMGGSSTLKDLRGRVEARSEGPRWDSVHRIWVTMRSVYARLTVGSLVLFSLLGTVGVRRPIESLADPTSGWLAWGVVVLAFGITLHGNAYSAYLQGVNQIALLRRWESYASIAAMITSVVVLLLGGRLLALVISHQTWAVVNVIRNRWLATQVEGGRLRRFLGTGTDREVMDAVWGSAIRSGIGVIFSRGVIISSGLIYAQVADAAALAGYLVAFRVAQMLMDFSNAPFYSKLPLLATLRSQGKDAEQALVAARGMQLSYWSFVIGAITVGMVASAGLRWIGSSVHWVTPSLWAMLSIAFFVERFGAMHLQLYSTTNHIIWHLANGISGTVYLVVSTTLLSPLGVFAFPVGILVGYLSFYSWYAPWSVYKSFTFDFWRFQRRTVLAPAVVMLLFVIGTVLRSPLR